MSVGPLFSTMAMLGGDILSLLSIIGSAVVLLDSLAYNSPLHRVGKFLDISVVCLIMGTLGQLAITFTGAQVERVGFLQFRVMVVNRLLALSLLFLLVSWFIRRRDLKPVRFWTKGYSAILRRAKRVDKLPLGTKYRGPDIDSMANQFAFYHPLAWLESWNFRRHISWLEGDTVSLDNLLDFEKELKKREVDSITIRKIIEAMLAWNHNEVRNDRLLHRVPLQRLPAMLQILAFFYGKSGRLHRSYRELIIGILQAEDEIKRHPEIHDWMPPEQFRLEAAKAISNLSNDWGKRDGDYLANLANHWLHYLSHLAKSASDIQMFARFQLEAVGISSRRRLGVDTFRSLQTIATKVKDSQTFTLVFQSIVPTIGLENTSALISLMNDFQEFEGYYQRITEQRGWWGPDFMSLFVRAKSTAELDRLLTFLATLAKDQRRTRYVDYTLTHAVGILFQCTSDALRTHKGQVHSRCWGVDWTGETNDDALLDELLDTLEKTILNFYLNTIWSSLLQEHKIHWEFSKFTDSIPEGIQSWQWTQDNDKTRDYWNWQEAMAREHNRFREALNPLLLPIFQKLKLLEIEALFQLLSRMWDIQVFTKVVQVPVKWKTDIEYQEAYDKWAGHYTQEIRVARPIGFVDHTFTFERPYLQNAIDLLNNMDKLHEAIQRYKRS